VDVQLPDGAFELLERLPKRLIDLLGGNDPASLLNELDAIMGGETALYVRPSVPMPEVTLVTQPSDTAAASKTLDSLLRDSPQLARTKLYRAVIGGQFVVSTTQAGIDAFRAGGAKLSSDPTFLEAKKKSGMPDRTTGFAYVNAKDALPLLALAGVKVPAGAAGVRTVAAYGFEDGGRSRLSAFLGVGDRGPSGQDRRPDLRFRPRRGAARRPERARRLRDADHDGPRRRRRRDHDRHVRRHPTHRTRADPRDRLHAREVRLRRRDVRRHGRARRAVARHRAARRCVLRGAARRRRSARPRRRRRPGAHVRLRHERDGRADATADHARAPDREAALRGPEGGAAAVSAAGRQVAGDDPLRDRRARAAASGRDRARAHLDAASRRPRRRDAAEAGPRRARPASDPAEAPLRREAARRQGLLLREPDRQVRHRRPDGRHRPDGA